MLIDMVGVQNHLTFVQMGIRSDFIHTGDRRARCGLPQLSLKHICLQWSH